jgi:hypothetical protein
MSISLIKNAAPVLRSRWVASAAVNMALFFATTKNHINLFIT